MRYRVLIIDDDPSFRNLVVSLLKKEYTVTAANDGDDGFAMLVNDPPDLAIVDVQMPRCDGLQVLRQIRTHSKLQRIPVVMLTGDASRETVIAAVTGGATDYIVKTAFTRDELQRKIKRALALNAPPAAATTSSAVPSGAPSDSLGVPAPVNAEAKPATATDDVDISVGSAASAAKDPELQAVMDAWE